MKGNFMELKRNENKYTIENIKISKYWVLTETPKSLLIKLDKQGHSVWVSKRFVKFSNYTNFLSVGIAEELEYAGYTNDDEDKIMGIDIIKYFNAINEKEEQ